MFKPLRFDALMALGVYLVLAAAASGADVQDKIDQLNAREKQLIEKLEGLHQRVRALEDKLDAIRNRRQQLLEKQAVRQLGKSPAATPSAAAPNAVTPSAAATPSAATPSP